MLTVNESRRSDDVQKIFKFISQFAVFLDSKDKPEQGKKSASSGSGNDDEENCMHPFLTYVCETLINVSGKFYFYLCLIFFILS